MKPRAYIHMGQPKTATTSIQAALVEYGTELEKSGYFPSRMLWCKDANLGPLNIVCADEDRFTSARFAYIENQGREKIPSLRDAVQHEIDAIYHAGHPSAIFSNEGLFFLKSKDEYQRVYELFAKFDIRIILFLREPISMLRSLFPTREISDDVNALPEHLQEYIDYESKIACLEDVFGADKVIVSQYERENMVQKFFRTVGVDRSLIDIMTEKKENDHKAFANKVGKSNAHLYLGHSMEAALAMHEGEPSNSDFEK